MQTIPSLPVPNLSQEDSPADTGYPTDAPRVALPVSDPITSAPPPIDAFLPVISDPKEDVLSQPPDFPSKSSAFYPIIVLRPNARKGVQGKHYFPKSLEDIIDPGEEGFGAAHIRWAAASLRHAVLQGDRLLQLVQATRSGTSSEASRGMNGEGLSPTETDDFRLLDQTIAAFVQEMPRAYRDPAGSTVDPLLYMAHLLPHV
ncbi:hypothetical protein FRC00_003799, partial [Tulasnella sp. 408]